LSLSPVLSFVVVEATAVKAAQSQSDANDPTYNECLIPKCYSNEIIFSYSILFLIYFKKKTRKGVLLFFFIVKEMNKKRLLIPLPLISSFIIILNSILFAADLKVSGKKTMLLIHILTHV
jgi:hypothetical protein